MHKRVRVHIVETRSFQRQHVLAVIFFDPISIQDASKWLGHVHVHLHLVPPFQSATACIEDANLRRDKFLREKIAIDTQH